MMTFGSLFSGIGGIDLGLERAGWKCKWQVENNEFCLKILNKHWPDVRKYEDIKEISIHELENVDMVAGGFPCQPVSIIGKRRGQSDPRWLWPEFACIISKVRPQYVFVENVPGLLHNGIGDVLVDLATLRYDAEWDCIPASFIGAQHKRERIFIVAHTKSRYAYPSKQSGTYQKVEWRNKSSSKVGNRNIFKILSKSNPRVPCLTGICGVINGVSNRMDRIRALGNAVVPQVSEYIGRLIIDYENSEQEIEELVDAKVQKSWKDKVF